MLLYTCNSTLHLEVFFFFFERSRRFFLIFLLLFSQLVIKILRANGVARNLCFFFAPLRSEERWIRASGRLILIICSLTYKPTWTLRYLVIISAIFSSSSFFLIVRAIAYCKQSPYPQLIWLAHSWFGIYFFFSRFLPF